MASKFAKFRNKRKDGFPRNMRFQNIPHGLARPIPTPKLRDPWVKILNTYKFFTSKSENNIWKKTNEISLNLVDFLIIKIFDLMIFEKINYLIIEIKNMDIKFISKKKIQEKN